MAGIRIAPEITLGFTMEVHGDNAQNPSRGPDAAHSGSSGAQTGLAHWFTPPRQVIITIIFILIALFIDVVVSRSSEGAALTKGTQPDATVFISTLILIYTVFMAVYGALLPIVIAKKREAWERLALALMLAAILLNLYRIVNSLGDLYTTTMGQLSPGKIHDASYEFIHNYFSINVVVTAVALFVVSRRSRAAEGRQVGADHPQMTDPQ
jgi:isoprenylcysteine carboxyl methyltransferase (ICMT) family protein YpbQ